MAEELLHRADVIAGIQQMRRERVPQRMAARALGEPTRMDRLPKGPLHDRLVQMMPTPLAGRHVHVRAGRRKHPLPRPIAPGGGELPRERPRDESALVPRAHTPDMRPQRLLHDLRQLRHPVAIPLPREPPRPLRPHEPVQPSDRLPQDLAVQEQQRA